MPEGGFWLSVFPVLIKSILEQADNTKMVNKKMAKEWALYSLNVLRKELAKFKDEKNDEE